MASGICSLRQGLERADYLRLFAFIDRSNIGNARIDGLAEDLHLTGNKFNIALVVFYVPYIIIDVPSNWIVKWVGAGIYLPAIMIAWGLVSTFLGFTKSFAGLIVARCFLGLFEGCLLPGIIVYLAMFYERHDMLWRIGLFYCAAPLSGAFGGLLATGLAQISAGGYDSWPWIFFIEGAITVVFGVVAIFYLPNTPARSTFLTEEEKRVALHRMQSDSHGASTDKDVDHEKFSWHWVKVAIFAPNTLFCALAWFFLLVPLYVCASTFEKMSVLTRCTELLAVPTDHHSRAWLQLHQGSSVHSATECGCFRVRANHSLLL